MKRTRQVLWAIAIIAAIAVMVADTGEAQSVAVCMAAGAATLASFRISAAFLPRLAAISLCALVISPAASPQLQTVFGAVLALSLGIYLITAFIAFAVSK